MKQSPIYFFFSLLIFFLPLELNANMTGGSFEIYADTFSVLQDQQTNGGSFSLRSTGGEFFSATSDSGGFSLRGGFQALERSSLSLSIQPSTVSLGQLHRSLVKSGSVVMTVTTDSATGYTVSATEDGNLRSGSNDINDVSDGNVSALSEEYGISTSGGGGLLSSDTAISGTVSVASANNEVTDQSTTITFEAAIGNSTRAGNYSHVVTFTATANP